MVSTERLADVFVEVADTLVDEFDLIDFLHNLADHAVDVSGASSAGLLLADQNDDSLHFMAASSAGARHLELFQLQHSEGPCLDCYRNQEPVITTDLAQETQRWPDFAPRAVEAGVRSVHAFPMRLRDRVIGALNVFGDEAAAARPDRRQDRAGHGRRRHDRDPPGAGDRERRAAHRAAAGCAEQPDRDRAGQGCGRRATTTSASTRRSTALRRHARNNHLRLVDMAHDVVIGKVTLPRS